MLLPSFESNGLSVQEKKRKIDFQDDCHGGHLGFLIGMILAIFDLKITLMLTTQFEVNKPFGSGEEVKNTFQDGRHSGHLGFPIGTILAIFDLCHPDASYQVSSQLAFGFLRRSEKRLSRWPPWRPSWISDQHDFSIFFIYKSL